MTQRELSLEEVLGHDETSLYALIEININVTQQLPFEYCKKFEAAVGFTYTPWYNRHHYDNGFLQHSPMSLEVLCRTPPKTLVEEALKLGYIEPAMKAAAALRQLGIYE